MPLATTEILVVRRTVLPEAPNRTKTYAMTMTPESGGTSLAIPYAPANITHDDLGATYITVSRPGLSDYYVYQQANLPRMSMKLTVADKKVTATSRSGTVTTAIAVIRALQDMARKSIRVRIAYGALESGLWYLTDMSLETKRRHPITDEITNADVSLAFARGDSSLGGSGPVTGGLTVGTKLPPVGTTPTHIALSTTAPAAPSARYYTTKSGDTLWAISVKFYGTGNNWRTIADANKIKDPRKLPYPLKLRIP